jgi:hypothetical protein
MVVIAIISGALVIDLDVTTHDPISRIPRPQNPERIRPTIGDDDMEGHHWSPVLPSLAVNGRLVPFHD